MMNSRRICPADGSQYKQSAVGLVFMESAAGLAMETFKVESAVHARGSDVVEEAIQSQATVHQQMLFGDSDSKTMSFTRSSRKIHPVESSIESAVAMNTVASFAYPVASSTHPVASFVSHTVEAVVNLWSLGVLTAAGCGIGSVHEVVRSNLLVVDPSEVEEGEIRCLLFHSLKPAETTSRSIHEKTSQNDTVPTNLNDIVALHQLVHLSFAKQPKAGTRSLQANTNGWSREINQNDDALTNPNEIVKVTSASLPPAGSPVATHYSQQPLAAGSIRKTQNAQFQLNETTSLHFYDWFPKPAADHSKLTHMLIPHSITQKC
ncbi:hypothetical protein F511_43016 [Dorcoceras hygrometricum]|uniref:Uncharacterized protein n=1 Tax=Dorcoceras hygrometricum TaxID=472368 RepID=A0A2Z7B6M7_9LAMI|nr:hypothetical protein F511_43016 [Dorcoceras hygrometricum]